MTVVPVTPMGDTYESVRMRVGVNTVVVPVTAEGAAVTPDTNAGTGMVADPAMTLTVIEAFWTA